MRWDGPVTPGPLAAARLSLEAALASNAEGHPVRASAQFRTALAHLDAVSEADEAGGRHQGETGAPRQDESGESLVAQVAHVRARCLLGLVMSDFELRADVPAGLRMLEEAERWAQTAGVAGVRTAVHGQKGLLWLRAGETGEALESLDAAVAGLDAAEPLDACRILLNRGSLHLELGDLARARGDLAACVERASALGDERLGFKARHNLGYVEFLAGDLPRALELMGEAATRTGGASPAVALLDRAQVLLEAGLVSEADATLGRAGELFAERRLALDLAQVELSRAECALLLRRPEEAVAWSRSARRRLARRGHTPGSARAELFWLRAQLDRLLDARVPDRRALGRLAVRAGTFAAAGDDDGTHRDVVRAARLIQAAALAAAGRHEQAGRTLAATGRLSGREPLVLALAHRAVSARLAFDLGQAARGRRHVAAGQALLVEHRRQLGSVEAVTAAAVHGERLTETEVAAALRSGDAAWVCDAVERGRATFAGAARVRPPDDPELAVLLAELRVAVERERSVPWGEGTGAERAGAIREAEGLRAAARERAWQVGGGNGAPTPVRAHALQDALGAGDDACVASVFVHRGQVSAVAAGTTGLRLLRLGPAEEVDAVTRRVAVDLQTLSGPMLPAAMRTVVRASLDRGLQWLDDHLVTPLGPCRRLHVATGGGLVTVPWGLVPSRAGLPTSVATRLVLAEQGSRRSGVVAIAGPGLRHAEAEAAAVAEVWPGSRVLRSEAATCAAVTEALRSSGLVHLAAHGHHEPESPTFSWLRMADGPLFAHELDGLDLGGSVVVLSACELGRATVRPGGEVLGLASVLLRLGAAGVVAALAPLRDDVAAAVMPALHAQVVAGVDPVEAFAVACSSRDEPVPLAYFAASVPGPGGSGRR